jgi:signal transduction histidine kinase
MRRGVPALDSGIVAQDGERRDSRDLVGDVAGRKSAPASLSSDDERSDRSRATDATDAFVALGEIAAELAHELANVLQIVAGSAYVARLAAERGDAAGSLPHVAKTEKNARLAQQLVEDVMALARGDAMGAEALPIQDVVLGARQEFAEDSAHWVDSVLPVGFEVRARVHQRLFARALHALYDNAIHASAPRAPTITTRTSLEPDGVIVEVADDGPGVPAEIASRVFEPLVSGRAGGSGLGLALARRIVRAHGGELTLVPGEGGAVFRVRLPR